MRAIVLVLILLSVPGNAFAQEGLPDPGITPDSLLYRLERAYERIQLTLAREEVSRAALRWERAQERMAEAQAMAERGRLEYLPDLMREYEKDFEQLSELSEGA
jgi:hypothetical protein